MCILPVLRYLSLIMPLIIIRFYLAFISKLLYFVLCVFLFYFKSSLRAAIIINKVELSFRSRVRSAQHCMHETDRQTWRRTAIDNEAS